MNIQREEYNFSKTATMAYQINFCPICSGAKSAFNFDTQEVEHNESLAFELAWEKYKTSHGLSKPRMCTCAHALTLINVALEQTQFQITHDTGWELCYDQVSVREFRRTITCSSANEEQIRLLTKKLIYDKCPGWGGVIIIDESSEEGRSKITFSTYWNSKD